MRTDVLPERVVGHAVLAEECAVHVFVVVGVRRRPRRRLGQRVPELARRLCVTRPILLRRSS